MRMRTQGSVLRLTVLAALCWSPASSTLAQHITAPAPLDGQQSTMLADASSAARARSRGLRPPKVIVSEKAHARAAELTNEAQAHYDAGRYEDATEAYRRAYAVVPAPELLFNLGQCQRLLGRPHRALRYFEAYLRLRPDAPHRPLVEQLIEESRLIQPAEPVAPQQDNAPAVSSAPEPESKPVQNASVMPLPPPEPLAEGQPQPTRLLADSRYDDVESSAVYERWWFWTAIAVVAAGAAVATYAVTSSQDDGESAPMTTLGMIAWE